MERKSKYSTYSIIVGLISWIYLIFLDYLIESDITQQLIDQGSIFTIFSPYSKYQSFWFQFISIGIGVGGIYFGIKALIRKKKLGVLGILISLGAILMSFYPLGMGSLF